MRRADRGSRSSGAAEAGWARRPRASAAERARACRSRLLRRSSVTRRSSLTFALSPSSARASVKSISAFSYSPASSAAKPAERRASARASSSWSSARPPRLRSDGVRRGSSHGQLRDRVRWINAGRAAQAGDDQIGRAVHQDRGDRYPDEQLSLVDVSGHVCGLRAIYHQDLGLRNRIELAGAAHRIGAHQRSHKQVANLQLGQPEVLLDDVDAVAGRDPRARSRGARQRSARPPAADSEPWGHRRGH